MNKNKGFAKKYKMYIIQHKGFVCNYEKLETGAKLSGKRYCFEVGSYKDAIDLNVEEVINCISDCANSYCNFRYKIIPEDEFLKEYEEYKSNYYKKLKCENKFFGFQGEGFDIDNILHQPKRKRTFDWACLMREYYVERGQLADSLDVIPYYSLCSDSVPYTSIIISYKKLKDGIEFETQNSIYVVKELKEIDYIDQLKEFDNFKISKHYKKLIDFVSKMEDEEMTRIMSNYI